MTLEDSIHSQRLHVLREAERLGNVSKACRRHGMSRTVFYRLRKRFAHYGSDGVHPKRCQARAGRPPMVPVQTERRVIAFALGVADLRAAVVQRPARPRRRPAGAGDDLAVAAPPAPGHPCRPAGGAGAVQRGHDGPAH